jgi:hypothetical protein
LFETSTKTHLRGQASAWQIAFAQPSVLLARLQLFFWIAYVFAAAICSVERICFSDSASTLVQVINTKWFVIQLDRYPAFMTQILPLLGAKIGLSVKSLVYLYSINFAIVSAGFYFLIRRFNQPIALMYTLFFASTLGPGFFFPHNELFVGHSIALFAIAYWLGARNKRVALLFVLCIAAVFTHATTIPLFVLALAMLWHSNGLSHADWLRLAVTATFAITFKLLMLRYNWYDHEKFEQLFALQNGVREISSGKVFLQQILPRASIGIVISILLAAQASARHGMIKLLLSLLAVLGYLFAIFTMYKSASNIAHFDSEIAPMILLLLTPLFGQTFKAQSWHTIAFSVLLSVFLGSIFFNYQTLHKQKQMQVSMLQEMQTASMKKVIYRASQKAPFWETWTIGYETLLLSKINGLTASTFLILDSNASKPTNCGACKDVFLTTISATEIDKFDRTYFANLNCDYIDLPLSTTAASP